MMAQTILMVALGVFCMTVQASEFSQGAQEKSQPGVKLAVDCDGLKLADLEIRALRSVLLEIYAHPEYNDPNVGPERKKELFSQFDLAGTPAVFQEAYKNLVELRKAPQGEHVDKEMERWEKVLNSYLDSESVGANHIIMLINGYDNPQVTPNELKIVILLTDEEGNVKKDEEGNVMIDEALTKEHREKAEKVYRQKIYDEMKEILPNIPLPKERDALAVAYYQIKIDFKRFRINREFHSESSEEALDHGLFDDGSPEYLRWWLEIGKKIDLTNCPSPFRLAFTKLLNMSEKRLSMSAEEWEKLEDELEGSEVCGSDFEKIIYQSGIPILEIDEYLRDGFSDKELEDLEKMAQTSPKLFEQTMLKKLDEMEKDVIDKIRKGYFKYKSGFDDYYIGFPE